jgi:hypothetical protein
MSKTKKLTPDQILELKTLEMEISTIDFLSDF